jgi:glycosyltransferase involved in cell wall biosynthesis
VTTSGEENDGNRLPVTPQAAATALATDSGPGSDQPRPRVSFAIPVRNGERFLGRALDSLLAQDFDDFEIVVCDNASTDKTPELMRRYADRDPRVRCILNEEDIGQIENFNRVYKLSRGEFFRWMGADDWLEPEYARKCVTVLDTRPDAVGVTTQWRFMDDAGRIESIDVPGPRVDAPSPYQRLCLTLRLLQNPQALLFDPIYSLIRRDALQRTGLLPINPWTDRLLAVELCLLGSFCHLEDCLSTRRAAFERWKERLPRYHERLGRKRGHRVMLYTGCAKIVQRAPLSAGQKLGCLGAIFAYWLRDDVRRRWWRIRRSLERRARKA